MPLPPMVLSQELRADQSPDMRRRRGVAALSLLGAAMGGLIALYQIGLLKRLPDPPRGSRFDVFDATKVDASAYAYKRLATPDAFLMLTTYAMTATLAAAGGAGRARSAPAIPAAMLAKTAYDVATNVALMREEWAENRKLCQYCLVAHLASWASLALAVPEGLRGVRALMAR